MDKKGAKDDVRQCESCLTTFHGVDTRRSYRRHLRQMRCRGGQVRRVQEWWRTGGVGRGRAAATTSALPRAPGEEAFPGLPRPSTSAAASAGDLNLQPFLEGLMGSDFGIRFSERLSPSPPPDDPEPQNALMEFTSDDIEEALRNLSTPEPFSEDFELQSVDPSAPPLPPLQPLEEIDDQTRQETASPPDPGVAAAEGGLASVPDTQDPPDQTHALSVEIRKPMTIDRACSPIESLCLADEVAPAPLVSDLVALSLWAMRLVPPYELEKFMTEARRQFPSCSIVLVTEVFQKFGLGGSSRPQMRVRPRTPPIVISSESETESDTPDEPTSVRNYAPSETQEETAVESSSQGDDDDDSDYEPSETPSSSSMEDDGAASSDTDTD